MINRRTVLVVAAALIPIVGGTILVLGRNAASGHPATALRASAAPTVKVTAPPTPAPTPKPTAAPTPAPPAPTRPPAPVPKPPVITVAYFSTLAPGAALPSDATCARQIASNPWEPRPDNVTANHTNVYAEGFRFQSSYFNDFGPAYGARVTGNYVGTTDQILRWAACKWGFDENTVRAQAVVESDWHQSTLGDCNGGATQPATHGCASVGILQVKGADIPPTEPGTWPAAFTGTAFNVDVAMANRRLCYDGKESWLLQFSPNYRAGDLWGCIGNWFSGRWHDAGAEQYIQKVQAELAAKRWTAWR